MSESKPIWLCARGVTKNTKFADQDRQGSHSGPRFGIGIRQAYFLTGLRDVRRSARECGPTMSNKKTVVINERSRGKKTKTIEHEGRLLK